MGRGLAWASAPAVRTPHFCQRTRLPRGQGRQRFWTSAWLESEHGAPARTSRARVGGPAWHGELVLTEVALAGKCVRGTAKPRS